MEYNIRSGVIRWQISRFKTIIHLCAIALTVSEILTFQICDLENLGQGYELQHSH